MKKLILKNRFTLLATVLSVYVVLLVIEGALTQRAPDLLHFENSLFELSIPELEKLSEQFD